jgi:hypothetical protein
MPTAKVKKTDRFLYFISHPETAVYPTSAIWTEALPLSRPGFARSGQPYVSYGEYFQALRTFFEKDDYRGILAVLRQRLGQPVDPGGIRQIRIYHEKHGEFYHPARIEIQLSQKKITFVLNVALWDTGKQCIAREYADLQRLRNEFARPFVPRVDLCGSVMLANGLKIDMFLGEWFEGYSEFHLARDPCDQQFKIRVWDDSAGQHYLGSELTEDLFRQVARIMAYYYNVETTEHIASWHHAAGDFVVRVDSTGLDIKLITVRRYVPLIRDWHSRVDPVRQTDHLLQALLIFFLKLCLRTRLDRLDGVGVFVWANAAAVQGTVKGFLEGLAWKPAFALLPGSIELWFKQYLSVCTQADLDELSQALVDAIPPHAPELPLIQQHLRAHVDDVFDAIQLL